MDAGDAKRISMTMDQTITSNLPMPTGLNYVLRGVLHCPPIRQTQGSPGFFMKCLMLGHPTLTISGATAFFLII